MTRGARRLALGAAAAFAAVILGALIVGRAPPSGRTSRSATRVGHKAFYELLGTLGYRVRRFERGVERLPERRSVLVALEPGAFLLREGGRFAQPMLQWIESGNGAVLTLGPDPDRGAELDDRGEAYGGLARRVVSSAQSVEEAAARRAEDQTPQQARERVAGRAARDRSRTSWSPSHLSRFLELSLRQDRLQRGLVDGPCPLTGPLAESVGAGGVLLTRPRVWSLDRPGEQGLEVLLAACGAPVALGLTRGSGRVVLLSEPRLLQNGAVSRGAHARLATRVVEHVAQRVGTRALFIEEFSHGGREVAHAGALLVSTRARWPTAQLLLVMLVAAWAWSGRRRAPVPLPRKDRRSRGEVIDAMAELYRRTGDVRGAAERLVQVSKVRIAESLSSPGALTASAPAVAAATGRDLEEVARLLDASGIDTVDELVARAEALRQLRLDLVRHTPSRAARS